MQLDSYVILRRPEVEREVGTDRLLRVDMLASWLTSPRNQTDVTYNPITAYRLAPSIVCRSESELFGVSMPRFAARGYIGAGDGSQTPNHLGFFNVRRLEVLVNHVSSRFPSDNGDEGPAHELSKNLDAIGDSLIIPPQDLLEQFWIVQCDLSHEYAEDNFLAVPFIQAIDLSGGLCAQGAAWMASVLLHDLVNSLHGLAEITAIANKINGTEPRNFSLSGMSFDQLAEYFGEVGASTSTHNVVVTNRTDSLMGAKEELTLLQRSYLLSGFPSIMAVDLGRLDGVAGSESSIRKMKGAQASENKSIYVRNRIPGDALPTDLGGSKLRTQHHAVVSIGYERNPITENPRIVFNDPSTYPLLETDFDNLILRRNYSSLDDESNGTNQVGTPTLLIDEMLSGNFRFQPILPQPVKVFLGDTLHDNQSGARQLGLCSIAGLALGRVWPPGTTDLDWAKALLEKAGQLHELGEFRLINVPDLFSGKPPRPRTTQAVESLPINMPPEILSDLNGCTWVYVELLALDAFPGCSVWIVWDATKEVADELSKDPLQMSPELGLDLDKLIGELVVRIAMVDPTGLVQILEPTGQQVQVEKTEQDEVEYTNAGNSNSETQGECIGLRPAIISSCFPSNPLPALGEIRLRLVNAGILRPDERLSVELYTAMHSELLPIALSHDNQLAEKSPLEIMSEMRGNEALLLEWVRALRASLDEHQLEVCGLASFIPEVTASSDRPERRLAVNALCVVQRVAHLLKQPANGFAHPARFIEVVGGSIVEGVFQEAILVPGGPSFGVDLINHEARTIGRSEAIKRLVSVLRDATELATTEYAIIPTPFLVELEPGPLFAINSMKSYAELISNTTDPYVQETGVNADLSHFRLSGDLLAIKNSQIIVSKIAHFHISGHGPAHLGDTRLTGLDMEVRDFIRYWRKSRGIKPGDMRQINPYHISLEFEAAPSIADVVASFQLLHNACL